jgi:hypothetical protein
MHVRTCSKEKKIATAPPASKSDPRKLHRKRQPTAKRNTMKDMQIASIGTDGVVSMYSTLFCASQYSALMRSREANH